MEKLLYVVSHTPPPFNIKLLYWPLSNVAELPYEYMIAPQKVPVNNIFVISRKFRLPIEEQSEYNIGRKRV